MTVLICRQKIIIRKLEVRVEATSKILQDSPSEIDEFGGKGHERTANALVDALDQLAHKDGAVGLEGSWGAGKSTVIKIAEKKLAARQDTSQKYALFTFDLWAHQSDDFRRAFLESFVAWLEAQNFLTKGRLEEARDSIRDRVKSVTVESSKKYNIFGIVFILILPLLPFIYSWLGPSAIRATPNGSGTPSWVIGTSILLVAILYISVIIRFVQLKFDLSVRPITWPLKKHNRSVMTVLSNCVSMFSRDVESETTTQNIRETDPTTIEFHRIFRSLLSEVQQKGITIVHILDNIDRLPKTSVPSTWSEVRALFAIRGGPRPEPHDAVVVVLPYDKQFVMKALDADEGPDDKDADIIEKTFSRILRVAPPVSHDWRDFFLAKAKECFSENIDADEAERLFRLLRYSFQKTGSHASPRRIIHFINEIGALDAQWRRTISLEACAVYILNRKKIERDPSSLRRAETIDPRYLQIADKSNIQREIAALTFNVEPESANQVLLHDPISKALMSNEPGDIQQLAEAPGFYDVLQDVLQDDTREWSLNQPDVLYLVCSNLDSLQLAERYTKACWKAVSKDIHGIEHSLPPDLEKVTSLCRAITGVGSEGEAVKLAEKLREALRTAPEKDSDIELFSYGKLWFSSMQNIYNALLAATNEEIRDDFRKQTIIPLAAEAVLGAAHEAAENCDYFLCDLIKTKCDAHSIEQAYMTLVESEPWTALLIYDQIEGYFSSTGDSTVLKGVFEILQSNKLNGGEEAKKRTSLLELSAKLCREIGSVPGWKDLGKPIAIDGSLAWHWFHAQEIGDTIGASHAAAMLMMLQDKTLTYALKDSHPHFGGEIGSKIQEFNNLIHNGTDDLELVALIAKVSNAYNGMELWRSRGLLNQNATLYQQVLIQIIHRLNFTNLNIQEALTDYPKIKALVDEPEVSKYLIKLADWEKFFQPIIDDKEKLLNLPSELLLDIPLYAPKTSLKRFLDAIDQLVVSATQADWRTAFSEHDDLLRLFVCRQKNASLIPIVSEYRPALLEHAISVIKGEQSIKRYKDEWALVVKGLPNNNRTTFANEILRTLDGLSVSEDGLLLFIECYKDIADRMKYEKEPDTAVDQIFSKLIVSTSQIAISFIDAHMNDIDDVLAKASEESKGAFLENIKLHQAKEGTSEVERLADLRLRFGISDDEVEDEQPDTEGDSLQGA